MKLYTLYDPTYRESLGIYTDKETACITMRALKSDNESYKDITAYESEDLETTVEEVEKMAHDERIKKFGEDSLIFHEILD